MSTVLESPPRSRVITVANPAAGSDWSKAVPGEEVWEPLAVTAFFHADATVVDRTPLLEFREGTRRLARVPPTAVVQAGGLVVYTYARGVGAGVGSSALAGVTLPLPEVLLTPGQTVLNVTSFLQPGDSWTDIAITARIYSTRTPGTVTVSSVVSPAPVEVALG